MKSCITCGEETANVQCTECFCNMRKVDYNYKYNPKHNLKETPVGVELEMAGLSNVSYDALAEVSHYGHWAHDGSTGYELVMKPMSIANAKNAILHITKALGAIYDGSTGLHITFGCREDSAMNMLKHIIQMQDDERKRIFGRSFNSYAKPKYGSNHYSALHRRRRLNGSKVIGLRTNNLYIDLREKSFVVGDATGHEDCGRERISANDFIKLCNLNIGSYNVRNNDYLIFSSYLIEFRLPTLEGCNTIDEISSRIDSIFRIVNKYKMNKTPKGEISNV